MERSYVHLNTCAEYLVRIWFYRWFAIREFAKTKGLKRLLHLDSDVLLFADLKKETLNFGSAALAIGSCNSYSGHCAFVNPTDALTSVCDFMVNMFKDQARLKVLRQHYEKQSLREGGGGVCDMYALGWMRRENALPMYELNRVENGRIFDQAIADNRIAGAAPHEAIAYFATEGERKKIFWTGGAPHFVVESGDPVRACTIHFQGGHKHLMRSQMISRPPLFYLHWLRLRVAEAIARKKDYCGVRMRHYGRGIKKRWRRLTT
jgi:hypothetical protein